MNNAIVHRDARQTSLMGFSLPTFVAALMQATGTVVVRRGSDGKSEWRKQQSVHLHGLQ